MNKTQLFSLFQPPAEHEPGGRVVARPALVVRARVHDLPAEQTHPGWTAAAAAAVAVQEGEAVGRQPPGGGPAEGAEGGQGRAPHAQCAKQVRKYTSTRDGKNSELKTRRYFL